MIIHIKDNITHGIALFFLESLLGFGVSSGEFLDHVSVASGRPSPPRPLERLSLGRGDDTCGNPHRAQISQFELFELLLSLKLDNQFSIERFEAAASRSAVPSPPLSSLAVAGRAALGPAASPARASGRMITFGSASYVMNNHVR